MTSITSGDDSRAIAANKGDHVILAEGDIEDFLATRRAEAITPRKDTLERISDKYRSEREWADDECFGLNHF